MLRITIYVKDGQMNTRTAWTQTTYPPNFQLWSTGAHGYNMNVQGVNILVPEDILCSPVLLQVFEVDQCALEVSDCVRCADWISLTVT